MKIWIVLGLLICSEVAFSTYITQTRECHSPDDCGANECCVLGMDRYAIPQCMRKGQVGEWCRAGAVPEDRFLYYPGGTIKEVKGVYTLFCPCDENSSCSKFNKCETLIKVGK